MKRLIAAVSLAVAASPALAQSFELSPTDPIMPAASYAASAGATVAQERVLAGGFEVTPTDPIMPASPLAVDKGTRAAPALPVVREPRSAERASGYFDPAS